MRAVTAGIETAAFASDNSREYRTERRGQPMNPSFAHLPNLPKALRAAAVASLLCITVGAQSASAQTVPVPELQAAQQAVAKAGDADADQYSPDWIDKARQSLSQAQAATQDKKLRKQAPQLAQRAQAEAELALVQSQLAVANAQLDQAKGEVADLQHQLDAPPPSAATTAAPAGATQAQAEVIP